MKKLGFFAFLLMLLAGAIAPEKSVALIKEPAQQVKKGSPTEVFYFHMTRRCVTCQAVETVAQEALKENFAEAMKKGELTFKSINLEDKENKSLMKKMKVSGQSLLIVNGEERIDITDKGFMYAKNDPEKFKSEVKTSVGKFIK
jgi:thiol-disulfide isomerase/thioredoxin